MKFPTHIILDVTRPTTVHTKTNFRWQQFYCNKFVKTNSLFSKQQATNKSNNDRILVTKTQVVATSNKIFKLIKKVPSSKVVNKYFTPYKSEFSKNELKNLLTLVKLINSNNLLINRDSKINFSLLSNTHKKQLYISDSFIKSFQLEKNLHVKFSLRELKKFNVVVKALKFTTWSKSMSSSKNVKLNTENTPLTFTPNKPSNCSNVVPCYKFCFQNFTTTLKMEQSSKRLWNKHIRSKYTRHPNRSRLTALFDINFLVKEMHYSKLKYSKTAERDIVSSGSAALFAGFIGFLISEKFGIELVDSGDFYFIVMYAVFIGFSLKAFVSGLETHVTNWDKYGNKQVYNSNPHKWFSLGINTFTYFFTILHIFLRLPYNVLHSTYTPLSFSLLELTSSFNLKVTTYSFIQYVSSMVTVLISFPKQASNYYRN